MGVYLPVLCFIFLPYSAFASSAGVEVVDYYSILANLLMVDGKYSPVFASFFSLFVLIVIGIRFRRFVGNVLSSASFSPSGRFTLMFAVESVMAFLFELTKEQCGDSYRRYLPLLCGIFLFVLVSNLSGLVPGFPPTTESFSMNLAIGLLVFLYYNVAGIKEHGFSYIKQFTGPFLVLAPMFFVLELVSHLARPLSLSFRLTANIFGDHLLMGVFGSMVPLVVPALFLFFGLLVACLQSFVFTLLTGIYINMAVSHDH